MSNLTSKEQEVLDNAPEGATHFTYETSSTFYKEINASDYMVHTGGGWYKGDGCTAYHVTPLSDLSNKQDTKTVEPMDVAPLYDGNKYSFMVGLVTYHGIFSMDRCAFFHVNEGDKICGLSEASNIFPMEDNSEDVRLTNMAKVKRMKVEYVECDILEAAIYGFECTDAEFYCDDKGDLLRITSVRQLALAYGQCSLYRKVETEITWQDELDSFLADSEITAYSINDDSEVKLTGWLESKQFIKMCHLVSSMNK